MTRLGIVVALLPEAACLPGTPRPGETVAIHGDILLHVSGIGPDRAARAAEQLAAEGVQALMSIGTAGGLRPGLGTGAVLVPERVASSTGSLPTHVAWRRHVVARLTGAGIAVTDGDMVESHEVLATPAHKTEFGERHGAVAVDMESAAVLRVATRHTLPAVVVRVIMDPVDMELPAFLLRRTDTYGRAHVPGLLADLLRSPGQLPQLLRTSRSFNRAAATLRSIGRNLREVHPGHDALTGAG